MQLNKKLIPLAVAALSVSTPLVLNAASSDEVSFKQMKYSESDDRINIDYSVLDLKKEIGTDYSLSVSLSYDSISGGTPIWDSISGGSSYTENDSRVQNTYDYASDPCFDNNKKYICKDTRNASGIIGDGQKDMSDYTYRNVEIDDVRKAASISLTKRTPSRDEISFGTAYSKESDFKSIEGSLSYLYNIDSSRNSSIAIGASYQSNSAYHYLDNDWKDFHIFNSQIGYTHTFSKNTVGQINYFFIRQSGVLSNPYQTIIRKFNVALEEDDSYYKYYRAKEKRPDEKNSAGITLDLVSKVHKNVSLHTDYRLYKDDWGILSHTLTTNAYINLSNGFTLVPLVRYYQQSASSFYKAHDSVDYTFNSNDYGTADERLSKFHGLAVSIGLEKKFTDALSCNIHYAQEKQSFGLDMKWVSVGLNYSF